MKRPAPIWNEILVRCNVKPTTAAIWSEIFAVCVTDTTFSAGDEDLRNFLGQTLHETCMLEALEENLNYSAEGLARTWPGRYAERNAQGEVIRPLKPNKLALTLQRKPQSIANHCYANRMGNGSEVMSDGWRYRGSGIPMITGKDNYRLIEQVTGLPVLKHPDMLRQPLPALQAGIAWWERRVPDAVLHDPEKVSEVVNGGHIGLDDRIALTDLATQALA